MTRISLNLSTISVFIAFLAICVQPGPNSSVNALNPKSKSGNGTLDKSSTSKNVSTKDIGIEEDEKLRPKRGYYATYYLDPRRPQLQLINQRQGSWGNKLLNKFRHRTSNLINTASAIALAHPSDDEDELEDNEMSGTFWNLARGYGGGGGGGGGYGKGVNKSAVGLLGFLSLLSLIQTALTTTTTAMGRRRRSPDEGVDGPLSDPSPIQSESKRIVEIVQPLLTSFPRWIQEENTDCVFNLVCSSNSDLVREFGEHGKSVGIMLGTVLTNMVKKDRRRPDSESELVTKLRYSGMAGRNGKNCEHHYPKGTNCVGHKTL